MQTWSDICADLRDESQTNEKEYERAIAKVIFRWGLKWNRNQIKQSEHIQVGSRSLKTDITLYKGDNLHVIIEVKRPQQEINNIILEQLTSYMAIKDVKVGIFIGKNIEVFFRDYEEGNEPKNILSINLEGSDPNGASFIKLFNEDTFSVGRVEEFYQKWKRKKENERKINDKTEFLVSPNGVEKVKVLLHSSLISEGFTTVECEKIIDRINIAITRKEFAPAQINTIVNHTLSAAANSRYRRTGVRKKIKITFPNGRTITPHIVLDALLEVIKFAKPERVMQLNILKDGENIVSIGEHRNSLAESKSIGNRYYVNTHSSTLDKFNIIKTISDRLGLNLLVELI